MFLQRAERLERTFWLWRLRLTRVSALLPTSVLTGAAAVGVLMADLLTTRPSRPRNGHGRPGAAN